MKLGAAPMGFLLSAVLATVAGAADLEIKSKIDAVTVFPSGAEVTRTAKVKVSSGNHTLIIKDLPPTAVSSSIRVEGSATGQFEISSVDTRSISVPRGDPKSSASERRKIEDRIEELQDEKRAVQAQVEIARARRNYASNLAKLPASNAGGGASTSGAREDWQRVADLIVGQIQKASEEANAAKLNIRRIDRQIVDLKKKLAELAPGVERRTEVKVFVTAGSALEADLAVRYRVNGANWRPQYDARLETGTKTKPASLTIARRAKITQRTREAWTNVALSLSTTRPGAGSSAPTPNPLTVDFYQPPKLTGRAVGYRNAPAVMQDAQPTTEAAAPRAAKPKPVQRSLRKTRVQQRRAILQKSAFQAVYRVPGRVTVAPTGEAKRVFISEANLKPKLVVQAVPRRDQRAFLYAKFKALADEPYMPGPVALFRDATFVGNGRLPQLAGAEEHDLGFGTDDAVTIKFSILKEKRGESGLISSSSTDERNFKITLKNMHQRPIAYAIVDRIPVSLNDEIRVDATYSPQPSKRNLKDKRGVIAWEGGLAAGKEQVFSFGYKLTWPADKKITYRR